MNTRYLNSRFICRKESSDNDKYNFSKVHYTDLPIKAVIVQPNIENTVYS